MHRDDASHDIRESALAASREARALQERAEHVAARLALIANSKRLLILCRLAEGEASVGAMQGEVGLSQSALSQHLAKLRDAGMVVTRRESQTIYYRLADDETRALMGALYTIFCAPQAPEEP